MRSIRRAPGKRQGGTLTRPLNRERWPDARGDPARDRLPFPWSDVDRDVCLRRPLNGIVDYQPFWKRSAAMRYIPGFCILGFSGGNRRLRGPEHGSHNGQFLGLERHSTGRPLDCRCLRPGYAERLDRSGIHVDRPTSSRSGLIKNRVASDYAGNTGKTTSGAFDQPLACCSKNKENRHVEWP